MTSLQEEEIMIIVMIIMIIIMIIVPSDWHRPWRICSLVGFGLNGVCTCVSATTRRLGGRKGRRR